MENKFIKVGFEFTAARAIKKNPNYTGNLSFRRGFDAVVKKLSRKISDVKWINNNYTSDGCGCEVSTNIIKSNSGVIKKFKEFNNFVNNNNLSIDITKATCGLGGCHIHMDLSYMEEPFKERFLKNAAIFMTNNPELNWGFNDVNDNVNANSLLTNTAGHDIFGSPILMTCFADDFNGWKIKPKDKTILKKFKNDRNPFKAFLAHPTHITLKKNFAIRYNEDYKTIEFRIFDMPKDLTQHLLHYDVAKAIYNHCYKQTEKNKLFNIKFHKQKDYYFSLDYSIKQFNKTMKTLGISPDRTEDMILNITTRYDWTKNSDMFFLF